MYRNLYALFLPDLNPRDASGVNAVPGVITRRALSSNPRSRAEINMICATGALISFLRNDNNDDHRILACPSYHTSVCKLQATQLYRSVVIQQQKPPTKIYHVKIRHNPNSQTRFFKIRVLNLHTNLQKQYEELSSSSTKIT
jgi:hypothetical protein